MRFGIFIYPGVEPIDLATIGVLSIARRLAPQIKIFTVAPTAGAVGLANGLTVLADYGVDDAPDCDILIVVGGPGWMEQTRSEPTLAFMRRVATTTKIASVCTGAMILAASGVLDGQMATTKRRIVSPESSPLEALNEYAGINAVEAALVDSGGVVTGGGVSLCIDATLYLLARELGEDVAQDTARIIEYDRAWAANKAALPILLREADASV